MTERAGGTLPPTSPASPPDTDRHGQPVGALLQPPWTPRPRPVPVTLTGTYVTVEPLTLDHAPDLFAALCGVDADPLWTYRPQRRPETLEELTDLVRTTLAAAPEMLTFALRPTGRAAEGIAALTRIEPATGQVEVAGVLYAPSLQRTTAATEAIHLLMRHAFDDLGYRRFEWKCDSLNAPSRRAALRLGFTYEGRFRHHMVTKGRNRDTDWFSVVDTEWPSVRAEHERWLDAANHDDAGRQRTPLRVAP